MIATVLLMWGVTAWVCAVLLCRFFALRARNERIWQAIERRRRGSGENAVGARREAQPSGHGTTTPVPRWDVTQVEPDLLSYHDAQLLRQYWRTRPAVLAARERLTKARA